MSKVDPLNPPKYALANGGQISAWSARPSDEAEARAKRDPQPGDRWDEMYSYWYHVDQRDDDRVLIREYSPPCDVRPDHAVLDKWMTVEEFADRVKYAHFSGSARWVAVAGQKVCVNA